MKVKNVIYTVSAILIAVGGYRLIKKNQKQKEDQWKDRNYILLKKHN